MCKVGYMLYTIHEELSNKKIEEKNNEANQANDLVISVLPITLSIPTSFFPLLYNSLCRHESLGVDCNELSWEKNSKLVFRNSFFPLSATETLFVFIVYAGNRP